MAADEDVLGLYPPWHSRERLDTEMDHELAEREALDWLRRYNHPNLAWMLEMLRDDPDRIDAPSTRALLTVAALALSERR